MTCPAHSAQRERRLGCRVRALADVATAFVVLVPNQPTPMVVGHGSSEETAPRASATSAKSTCAALPGAATTRPSSRLPEPLHSLQRLSWEDTDMMYMVWCPVSSVVC